MLHDLRYALRTFRQNPGWTVLAVLSLALGLGVNTAVFLAVSALFLQPLPVQHPDRLVRVYGGMSHVSHPNYLDLRDRVQGLSGLAGHRVLSANLGQGEGARRTALEVVTPNFFAVLGLSAAHGRTFQPAERGQRLVVLSHGLWQRQFGGDRDVVGHRVLLNGQPFDVVGVLPETFRGVRAMGMAAELYAPALPELLPRLEDRTHIQYELIGRLRNGVAAGQAAAEVRSLVARLEREHPAGNLDLSARTAVYPLTGFGSFRGQGPARIMLAFLVLLQALVGMVLLIACGNVANLLLARATARRREIAVRLALGAGRARLVRQLLTESVLLSLLGGACGLLLAVWTLRLVPFQSLPVPVPLELAFEPTLPVLGVALGLSLLTGLLFGLAPAWQLVRPEVTTALKDDASAVRRGRRWGLRQALVVGQVATSLVLLVSAGLFLRSLQSTHAVDPGFDVERQLTVGIDFQPQGYSEQASGALQDRLTREVAALPGVQGVSLAAVVPLTLNSMELPVRAGATEAQSYLNMVGPGYFGTMGIPLRYGRGFTPQDRPGAPEVAVVNETFARRLFAGRNPVGQTVRAVTGPGQWGPPLEIVGVVRDSKYRTLGEEPFPLLYQPLAQRHSSSVTLHVRTAGDPRQLVPAVKAAVTAVDSSLVAEVRTMPEHMEFALLPSRVGAALLGALGALGLTLAVVGLYGVMAYAVSRRVKELGLRMALGASRGNVLQLVLRDGGLLIGVGSALGLVLSLAATRVLTSFLSGVSPADPLTFAAVAVLLGGVGLLAAYGPARRATRIDPMVALRHE